MIKQKESRIISYHDLSNMSRIFDVKLSSKERHVFIGKLEGKSSAELAKEIGRKPVSQAWVRALEKSAIEKILKTRMKKLSPEQVQEVMNRLLP